MSRTTRFVAAGTVAGAAVNVLDGTLYSVLLGQDTAIAMERLGLTTPGTAGMILYTVLGFLIGFVGVWLYLGVRARLGPGPRSAVKTGVAVWAVAYLAPFLDLTIEGVFTPRMFWIAAGYTLLSTPLALLAGAWAYREAEAPGSHAEAEPETAPMR